MRTQVPREDVPYPLGQGVRCQQFQRERDAPHWLIGGNNETSTLSADSWRVDRHRCADRSVTGPASASCLASPVGRISGQGIGRH